MRIAFSLVAAVAGIGLTAPVEAQLVAGIDPPELRPAQISPAYASAVRRTRDSAAFKLASASLEKGWERMIAETILITEVPAPPFMESARGDLMMRLFRDNGLTDVQRDAVGNIYGVRRGQSRGPVLVVAAHMDTVFPAGTDVKVKREGNMLKAPGVGDNSASLASLLAMIRAMDAATVRTRADIVFVANVGEEGPGNLRGMRHLFSDGPFAARVGAFIAIEPGLDRVTNGGVGSKRYRVTFKGPGGHSFLNFGTPNPAYALGNLLVDVAALTVPSNPRTTFSVGVVTGGTSVNAIPESVQVEIDLRSQGAEALKQLDAAFGALPVKAAAAETARAGKSGKVTVTIELMGDRPVGRTDPEAAVVQIAASSLSEEGIKPRFTFDSSDSNYPMSIGRPAVTLGSGFLAARFHSVDEFVFAEPKGVLRIMRANLATIIATAQSKLLLAKPAKDQ